MDEIAPLVHRATTPEGRELRVTEVLLVHDNGPDASDETIRDLARRHPWIRPVWLSRNFGQHPATLAGIAASGGEWVVTLDEDGQHDPAAIGSMLDTAMRTQSDVVYAKPTNEPPHGPLRNLASRGAKRLVGWFASAYPPTTSTATDSSSVRSPAASRRMPCPHPTWLSPGWPAAPRPARSRCAARVTAPRVTTCGRCSRTSGGWSSPAGPSRCALSRSWELAFHCWQRCWRWSSSSDASPTSGPTRGGRRPCSC